MYSNGCMEQMVKEIAEIRTSEGRTYPVFSGSGTGAALEKIWKPTWRQAVLISDSNTGPLFSADLAARLRELTDKVLELTFPAGERNKNRATKELLEDSMVKAGIDRTACVVAVGGGVVLDMAGFVAATYMRGVDHVNIATSLLAQVDAAVGGKTGVDTPYGKNLIGAFHQPRAVFIDVGALESLPERELKNGMAELVKNAVVADTAMFEELESRVFSGKSCVNEEIVSRSVRIKAEVVGGDEKEGGRRRILNFGHTIGHAVEMAMNYEEPHGFCVSIGMVAEAMLAEKTCGFPRAETERLKSLLMGLGLPVRPQVGFDAIAPYLSSDKKNRDGEIHCSLPLSIGCMDDAGGLWTRSVALSLVKEAMGNT